MGTELTAARARELAKEIRAASSGRELDKAIKAIGDAAQEGHCSVPVDMYSARTVADLKALGYSLSNGEGSIVWISW